MRGLSNGASAAGVARFCCLVGVLSIAINSIGTRSFAINIVIDYSDDTTGFFTSHPTAKATLEAAAQDLNNVITTSLGATSDTSSGISSTASSSLNFNYSITNP